MFVLSFDLRERGRGAGSGPDRVPDLLAAIAHISPRPAPERTSGDEVLALVDRAEVAVAATLLSVEIGGAAVGVGIGPAEPGITGVRELRGPALHVSREALEASRRTAGVPISLRAADARQHETARDAEAVLRLIGRIVGERGPGQRRAVDAARRDPSARQSELADRLGIRQQTVSRALRTAGWHEEVAATPLAERLLAMIDLTSERGAR